jgi:hypothetical protein
VVARSSTIHTGIRCLDDFADRFTQHVRSFGDSDRRAVSADCVTRRPRPLPIDEIQVQPVRRSTTFRALGPDVVDTQRHIGRDRHRFVDHDLIRVTGKRLNGLREPCSSDHGFQLLFRCAVQGMRGLGDRQTNS